MNRYLLSAAFLLAFASSLALAQQTQSADGQQAAAPIVRQHHGRSPERETRMLSKRLNLTPDQKSKLEPILADRDQKLTALRGNTALTPQDKHQQMRAIQESTKQQLDSVLTPDQIEQMKAMRHQHSAHQQSPTAPGL